MYSAKVVERNIAAVSDSLGISLIKYDDDSVDEMTAHLVGLVKEYDKEGKPLEWIRQPTKQEQAYIDNERLMCKFDFRYFANRYSYINLISIEGSNSGVDRLGRVGFMQPQEVFLDRIAKTEERMYEMVSHGLPVDGIRFFINKGRQLHFTAICRMLSNHRSFFWPDTQALAASINDDMVHELFSRDQIMYDHLPWFLRPLQSDNVKNQHIGFKALGNEILYHQANQHGAMGSGRSIKVAHMTECALWDDAVSPGTLQYKLDNQLFPAIPQDLQTLYLLESSSNGLGGWWYDQIHLILRGKSLFELFFSGWYSANKKHRREPPEGWEPGDYVKMVAEKVERTSSSYLGFTVTLDKQQMYWYETTMLQHEKRLAEFLTNYPTDLSEAFQNFGTAAFSVELLDSLRKGVGKLHGAYDPSGGIL